MSNTPKITSKNLTYDKSEPAFLRRLRNAYGGDDGRERVQIARPSKARLRTGADDGEDEPLVLDERGEVVVLGAGGVEGLVKVGNAEGRDEREGGMEAEMVGDGGRKEQVVAEVGAGVGKKRKVARVVAGEGDGEGQDEDEDPGSAGGRLAEGKTVAAAVAPGATKDGVKTRTKSKTKSEQAAPKAKQKGKKIKLSFDEPDE